MNSQPFNQRLYEALPAVYRNRDNGDLQHYLNGFAVLLDQLHATLEQKLADHFAAEPLGDAQPCQDWLIPYLGDLLDVKLVSPSAEGRRLEVANAVTWRQAKGTLHVIEQIAQAVGQLEVVLHEGWQRVATTATLNTAKIAATHFGWVEPVPNHPPALAARHPQLPAVFVDMRYASGALISDSGNPAAQSSQVDGQSVIWRQAHVHGVPIHPNHFDDRSVRTVDFSDSDWQKGHYHPHRILLYTLPAAGFFESNIDTVTWQDEPNSGFLEKVQVIEEQGRTIYRNKSLNTETFTPVRIRRKVMLGQVPDGVGDPDAHIWRFEGLIIDNLMQADSGRIELVACALRKLEVHSQDQEEAVITARGCLFKAIQAATGLAQLEYCTVLEDTLAEVLNASDCIFMGPIHKHHSNPAPPDAGCVRFSRVAAQQQPGGMRFSAVTRHKTIMYNVNFGQRSCGVLHPATSLKVLQGAEDGTEMGAFHDDYLAQLTSAVKTKLADYLPVGLSVEVIPDPTIANLIDK